MCPGNIRGVEEKSHSSTVVPDGPETLLLPPTSGAMTPQLQTKAQPSSFWVHIRSKSKLCKHQNFKAHLLNDYFGAD